MQIPAGWEITDGILAPVVGTAVRVREWESMAQEFGINEHTKSIEVPASFLPSMRQFCGEVKTVTKHDLVHERRGQRFQLFRLDNLPNFYFDICMVTPPFLSPLDTLVRDITLRKRLVVSVG